MEYFSNCRLDILVSITNTYNDSSFFFLTYRTGNGIILVSFSRNPSSKIIKDHSWLSSNNDWMNVFFSTVTGLIQVMSWFQCQACTFCPTYRMTLTLFFFSFCKKTQKNSICMYLLTLLKHVSCISDVVMYNNGKKFAKE